MDFLLTCTNIKENIHVIFVTSHQKTLGTSVYFLFWSYSNATQGFYEFYVKDKKKSILAIILKQGKCQRTRNE